MEEQQKRAPLGFLPFVISTGLPGAIPSKAATGEGLTGKVPPCPVACRIVAGHLSPAPSLGDKDTGQRVGGGRACEWPVGWPTELWWLWARGFSVCALLPVTWVVCSLPLRVIIWSALCSSSGKCRWWGLPYTRLRAPERQLAGQGEVLGQIVNIGKAGHRWVIYSLFKGWSVHVLANGSAIFLCVNPGGILLSENKRRLSIIDFKQQNSKTLSSSAPPFL